VFIYKDSVVGLRLTLDGDSHLSIDCRWYSIAGDTLIYIVTISRYVRYDHHLTHSTDPCTANHLRTMLDLRYRGCGFDSRLIRYQAVISKMGDSLHGLVNHLSVCKQHQGQLSLLSLRDG